MTIETAALPPGGSVRDRGPAHLLMHACLRASSSVPPPSRFARLAARDPMPIEARPWYMDAVAQLRIARSLQRLGPAWTTLHSLPVGHADEDLDHLVIGPGGVFPITTQRPLGRQSWGARKPVVQSSQHIGAWEAAGIRLMLAPLGLGDDVVLPVLVLIGDGSPIIRRPRGVHMLEQGRLTRWLRSRPRVLDAATVAQIVALVERPGTWRREAGPLTADPRPDFQTLQRTVRRAARVRSIWRATAVVGALGVVALALEPFGELLRH